METQRPLALYTDLQGRAWIAAAELSVERLGEPGGIDFRCMEIEVTKMANVMSLLFRKCKRKGDQSVREFNPEYERLLMHLREPDCELPPLVKALFRQAEVVRSRRDEHPQQCQQQV